MDNPARLIAAASLLITAALGLGCFSEPELEFADWILPMPEGTPVHEYAAVPVEERDPDAVQMIEDLVIGDDLTNPTAILYQPGEIVATPDGTIFVADGGASNVKMFAPDGRYLKTLGQEGQGPGEFGRVSQMTIAGETLVIFDTRNRRFSLWSFAGEHLGERSPEDREFLSSAEGLADGTVIALSSEFDPEAGSRMMIVHRSTAGEDLGELLSIELEMGSPIDRSNPRASMQRWIESYNEPRVSFAVAARERLFVSPMHEYQVLAMQTDGEIDWALRAAWQRLPFSDYMKQSTVDSLAEIFDTEDEIGPDDLDWSTVLYSGIQAVLTDDSGNLYVFPGIPRQDDRPPESRPVDVYSPDGEFLAAGIVPNIWRYARGEYVYGIRPDVNEENVVVRYRLGLGAK